MIASVNVFMIYSVSVTIGQYISICIGHSGGDRYFVCMVHNRWIEVGTWAVARRP